MSAEPSPLADITPDQLSVLFESDPLTLTDSALERMVIELRRRRNAFVAEEAAKAAAGKKARTKPTPQPTSAAPTLDKPTAEVDLNDLMGGGE